MPGLTSISKYLEKLKDLGELQKVIPKQVIPLHHYLIAIRSHLKPKGEELIPGSVRNIIAHLLPEIQGLNPIITNALHIRGSVVRSPYFRPSEV